MKNNNQFILFKKIAGTVCMLALFSCFMSIIVCAAENTVAASQDVTIVSSRTTDEGVYVYIKGISEITNGSTVQIGNTLCEDIQVAGVASMGIPVKTIILFDNSQSLSKRWGSQAKELVLGLIENHAEGEEIKITTFADSLNVISDFSTEYDSLKAAVEGIQFLDQASYLTDILYDLLKQSSDSHEANYTRFIIITDGADDNDIKYTQAELSDLMKSSGVVIHTVGVKASNNNALLENLFSYARLTGGTYNVVESDTDVGTIREMIDKDHSLLCLRLVPTADIMDGGRKEAKFNLNTSNGMATLTASLQMPFADVSNIPSASAESSTTPTPAPTVEKPELPSIAVEPQGKEEELTAEKTNIMPVIVIAVIVLVIAIVIIVVLLVFKSKKKKQAEAASGEFIEVPIPSGTPLEEKAHEEGHMWVSASRKGEGKTVMLGAQGIPSQSDEGTVLLGGQRQCFIALTDINNPQRSFRVPIVSRIVIGRKEGDIILGHDGAVSHTHCEIIKKGNLFYVNDLKSRNGTFYGDMRVYNETPIMNGGILRVGAYKYKITIENSVQA